MPKKGARHSEESKQKMRDTLRKKPRPKWLREKCGKAMKSSRKGVPYALACIAHWVTKPCFICGGEQGKGKSLARDHNKETGERRGLLCDRCNRALGQMNHDPNLLRRMASYLEPPKKDAPRVLCLCLGGVVRSVTVGAVLKYKFGFDALAASIEKNESPTLMMLYEWADVILVVEEWMLDTVPVKHKSKLKLVDTGPDVWGLSNHKDLVAKILSLDLAAILNMPDRGADDL